METGTYCDNFYSHLFITTVTRKLSFSMFSSNSEANALELLKNLEDMFPLYYMYKDICNGFKSSTTHYGVIRRERVNALRIAFCSNVFSVDSDVVRF